MYKLFARLYQWFMRVFVSFIPWRYPEVIQGENCITKLPQVIKNKGINKVLIVTDKGITSIGLMDSLLESLKSEGIDYFIYDDTVPNPTVDNIEEAYSIYVKNGCQGLIGFGGGSSIDCAKGVGARVVRPKKSMQQMKGLLKVVKKIPPLFAVPTTAGTGSETSLATVVSNKQTHEKYSILDIAIMPDYAVLDPLLTINLPPHITAATGMDALTHAVEAYIGKSNTKDTIKWSREAVKLIFENLYECYSNGSNIHARANMQQAAYLAGKAFTRAYVGYVHAIAHTLGGFYNIPHGFANAVILPYVLEYYGESAHKSLGELADLVGLTQKSDTDAQKAQKFINALKELNKKMDISDKISGILDKDIPVMVKRTLREAYPLYPVPKILYKKDFIKLYYLIKE